MAASGGGALGAGGLTSRDGALPPTGLDSGEPGLVIPDRPTLLWAAILGSIACLLALPFALSTWSWTPDAIEHVAIANAFVHGRGWVDPVFYNYFVEGGSPLPAVAMRAPMISLLIALPLSMGADVTQVQVLHAIWAGLVSAGMVVVARRFMTLGAAVAATSLLVLSPAWRTLTLHLWTEVTSVAAFLVVLWTSRGVLRSIPGALLCALATALAWLTRPNLAPLVLAVAVAVIWYQGPHKSLRSAPFWSYLGGFAVLFIGVQLASRMLFGVGVYEGYAVNVESLRLSDVWRYGYERVGAMPFVLDHAGEILYGVARNGFLLFKALFLDSSFHFAGWWAVIAVVILVRKLPRLPLEQRINALAGIGLSAIVVFNYVAFDPKRYPLMSAVTFLLFSVPLIVERLPDAARRWTSGRLHARRIDDRLFRALPYVLCLLLIGATTLGPSVTSSLVAWQAVRSGEILEASHREAFDPRVRALCAELPSDAVVAVERDGAWILHLWCGNATYVLPSDIGEPGIWERYLAERRPSHVLVLSQELRVVKDLPGLSYLVQEGPFVLFAVARSAGEARAWDSPQTIACAGRPRCDARSPGSVERPGDRPAWR